MIRNEIKQLCDSYKCPSQEIFGYIKNTYENECEEYHQTPHSIRIVASPENVSKILNDNKLNLVFNKKEKLLYSTNYIYFQWKSNPHISGYIKAILNEHQLMIEYVDEDWKDNIEDIENQLKKYFEEDKLSKEELDYILEKTGIIGFVKC